MITPTKDYVAATKDQPDEKTASGIYIPESAQQKPNSAKVVAVGDNITDIAVGNTIIYKTYNVTEVTVDNTDYLLIKDEDILAKLTGGTNA